MGLFLNVRIQGSTLTVLKEAGGAKAPALKAAERLGAKGVGVGDSDPVLTRKELTVGGEFARTDFKHANVPGLLPVEQTGGNDLFGLFSRLPAVEVQAHAVPETKVVGVRPSHLSFEDALRLIDERAPDLPSPGKIRIDAGARTVFNPVTRRPIEVRMNAPQIVTLSTAELLKRVMGNETKLTPGSLKGEPILNDPFAAVDGATLVGKMFKPEEQEALRRIYAMLFVPEVVGGETTKEIAVPISAPNGSPAEGMSATVVSDSTTTSVVRHMGQFAGPSTTGEVSALKVSVPPGHQVIFGGGPDPRSVVLSQTQTVGQEGTVSFPLKAGTSAVALILKPDEQGLLSPRVVGRIGLVVPKKQVVFGPDAVLFSDRMSVAGRLNADGTLKEP